MAVESGQMRTLCRILQPVDSPDARGSSPAVYRPDGEIWAAIEPLKADELTVGDALETVATHRVRTHYTTRITSRSVLETVREQRRLEVVSLINVDELDRHLELHCREAVA